MEESKAHKIIKWIIFALMLATNLFIIVNACIPGAKSAEESSWIVEPVANIINTIKEDTINSSNYDNFSSFIRKFVGHFSLFGLSGVLTTMSLKMFYYDKKHKLGLLTLFSSLSGILLAFLSEGIQLIVPGRSGELLDVGIDLAGYFLGMLIIVLILSILKLKANHINRSNIETEGEEIIMPSKKPAKPAKKKEEKKPAKKAAPVKKPVAKKEEKKEVTHRNYHVVKRSDGKWEVKYAGGEKAIKLFNTQAEATAYTKQMAKNQGGVMLVHNSKGQNKGRIKAKK